jgi:hypothetical protein
MAGLSKESKQAHKSRNTKLYDTICGSARIPLRDIVMAWVKLGGNISFRAS